MANTNAMSNDVLQQTTVSVSASATSEDRLARIMDAYLVSLEQAVPLNLEDLALEHPDLADDIRSITASLDLLHQATKQMRPATNQTDKQPLPGANRLGERDRLALYLCSGRWCTHAARRR